MNRITLILLTIALSCVGNRITNGAFVITKTDQATAQIVVDQRGTSGVNSKVIADAGRWLSESLAKASGITLTVTDQVGTGGTGGTGGAGGAGPTIIIARADQYAKIAIAGNIDTKQRDAFCIVTRPRRVYILGNSAAGARNGVATLLHALGFRWFNPSPRWWITPTLDAVRINMNIATAPALASRNIWYAYGPSTRLTSARYKVWAYANRLGAAAPLHTGHSYGNIIGRNADAFKKYPQYFALLDDGTRDTKRGINARKFCVSNPGLIELVANDRIALLEQRRKANPYEFMVSVDPSDGRGACVCDSCKAIGTTTDRVFYLANAVAKRLRAKYPDAWVGLYAYSSHREPVTIDVEPNVYVQVAMGFNRTAYTLPQLVDRWSQKVGAIGLREYYGVEAWDWGLPGRVRGSQVAYHKQWIPYYVDRKLNALNAETNANWGAQTLGCYVAARLMWDPRDDVDALRDDYFTKSFGHAAKPMRRLQQRFDRAPALEPNILRAMFDDVKQAYELANDESVRMRIVDMMAYMHYIVLYRNFSLAYDGDPTRRDAFYKSLKPLITFVWQIRDRDMAHYMGLARRLCNGVPLMDGRFTYWLFLSPDRRPPTKMLEKFGVNDANLPDRPVWMTGQPPSDAQIVELFYRDVSRLANDNNRRVYFSRYIDYAWAPAADGDDGSGLATNDNHSRIVKVRGGMTGYIASAKAESHTLSITPISESCIVTVYSRGDTVLQTQTVTRTQGPQNVILEVPKANDYRFTVTGDFDLRVQPNAPIAIEASPASPVTLDGGGRLSFYVPRGADDLVLKIEGRLTIVPPHHAPITVSSKQVDTSTGYVIVPVPPDAAGMLWHVATTSRGTIALVNTPPLMHPPGARFLALREVAQGDGLTTTIPTQAATKR